MDSACDVAVESRRWHIDARCFLPNLVVVCVGLLELLVRAGAIVLSHLELLEVGGHLFLRLLSLLVGVVQPGAQ